MSTDLRPRDPGPELPGLAATLGRAADQHFDLGAVRAGIDGLVVRRRRRRRQQVTAGLAAAAAVAVVGGTTWLLAPERDLGQVARPSPPVVTAAPSPSEVVPPTGEATPSPEVSPTEPDRSLDLTSAPSPADVPDAVELSGAEAGEGLQEQLDLSQDGSVHTPVVSGLMCNQGLPGLSSVGGRQWMFYDPLVSTSRSVDVAVTVFPAGSGADALTEVATDTGQCRWVDQVRDQGSQPWAAASPDRLLVQGEDVFGAATYRAVVRVQDVLVGVQVTDDRGADRARTDAQALAELVAQRVATSGMPAARG